MYGGLEESYLDWEDRAFKREGHFPHGCPAGVCHAVYATLHSSQSREASSDWQQKLMDGAPDAQSLYLSVTLLRSITKG